MKPKFQILTQFVVQESYCCLYLQCGWMHRLTKIETLSIGQEQHVTS